MTWVRIDDVAFDHPKLIGASDSAIAAWLRGLAYASRFQTDGSIPRDSVKAVTRKKTAISELEQRGLWHANGNGWLIHDYLDYQPSRDEIAERRAKRAEAGRKGALAKWQTS